MPQKTKTNKKAVINIKNSAKLQAPIGHERRVMAWEAPEYIHHEKSIRWYMVAIIALLALLVWAFFSDNWTMAIALIVFAAVYYYTHTYHPPKVIEIIISEMGIQVGAVLYPYSHIQAFWVMYGHGLKTLNLRVTGHWFADVVIQLESQDPVEIRQYLVTQIPEWEGKQEKLGDMILRLLKF